MFPVPNKQRFLNVLGVANVTGPLGLVNRLVWPFLLLPNFSGSVKRFVFDSDGRILSLLFVFSSLSKLNINIYAPNLLKVTPMEA